MRIWVSLACAGLLTAGVGFVAAQHGSVDDARNGRVKVKASLEELTHPPAEVKRILEQSCSDCHSEKTRWPWYSHLPVIGSQMEEHVRSGRLQLDLSDWKGHIEASEAEDKLESMCIQAKARKMPLGPYMLLHPQARLSDNEVQTLCEWTTLERTRPESLTSATDGRMRSSDILK